MGRSSAADLSAQSRGSLVVARCCAAGFAFSLVALLTAQLALMSVLDEDRAELAAEQIAESRFTADIIEQSVVRAVAPVAGEAIAAQVAATASTDPQVLDVVETSLVDAHRQIVDPDAPAEVIDGNVAVGAAIVESLIDSAAAAGIDLAALGFGDVSGADAAALDPAAIARRSALPAVVPTDLPGLGLLQVAETTRIVALLAVFLFGALAVVIHPRPGLALRGLGLTTAIVCGGWLVALLVTGWVIGLVANTLFGEMIEAVWSDAVPSMLLLVGAGVVIGAALVFAGLAISGYDRQRSQRRIEY